MTRHYILNDAGDTILAASLDEWIDWITHHDLDRIIGKTMVGDWEVSTVFLGLDHNYTGIGPPILWKTMIFQEAMTDDRNMTRQKRCSGTREQAEAMHIEMVEYARSKQTESRKL